MIRLIIRAFSVLCSVALLCHVLLFEKVKKTSESYVSDSVKTLPVESFSVETVVFQKEKTKITEESFIAEPKDEQENIQVAEQTGDYAGDYADDYVQKSLPDSPGQTNESFVGPTLDLERIYSRIKYPAAMKNTNIECSFIVRILIESDGTVKTEIPDNVPKPFRNEIFRAFKNATAVPAKKDGKPISVTFTIPVEFSLR